MSDDEGMTQNHNPKLEEDQDGKILLILLFRGHSMPNVEVVPYDGKLDTNVVLDWISEMEKFFEYKNTHDNRMVKIIVTRLKGHSLVWWENL